MCQATTYVLGTWNPWGELHLWEDGVSFTETGALGRSGAVGREEHVFLVPVKHQGDVFKADDLTSPEQRRGLDCTDGLATLSTWW